MKLRRMEIFIELGANVLERFGNSQRAIEQLEQYGKFRFELEVRTNVTLRVLESDHAATAIEDDLEFSAKRRTIKEIHWAGQSFRSTWRMNA